MSSGLLSVTLENESVDACAVYIVVIVVATFIFSSSLDSVLCSASVAIAKCVQLFT